MSDTPKPCPKCDGPTIEAMAGTVCSGSGILTGDCRGKCLACGRLRKPGVIIMGCGSGCGHHCPATDEGDTCSYMCGHSGPCIAADGREWIGPGDRRKGDDRRSERSAEGRAP